MTVATIIIRGSKTSVEHTVEIPNNKLFTKISPTAILDAIKQKHQDSTQIVRLVKQAKDTKNTKDKKGVNCLNTKYQAEKHIRVAAGKTYEYETISKRIEVVVDCSAVDKYKKQMTLEFGRYQRIHTMLKIIKESLPNVKDVTIKDANGKDIPSDIHRKSINYIMNSFTDQLHVVVSGVPLTKKEISNKFDAKVRAKKATKAKRE
jgi:hypothetical protein